MLAFACAFTMFAGAASFADQADISQTEAVDMLTSLGVIKGYEDGSFRPDDIVTRAEMAKMIYTIRNGGSDTVTQYEGYTTPFTDVENVNHWAKGYIAYCYANGIIAGKSATKFDPDGIVTGAEAAKMALVLLGYDANRANLVGTAWLTNTVNLATQKDLFKDYSISITGGCDRQFAAQLLYNTLWACTVRWSSDAEDYQDVVEYTQSDDGVTAKPLNVTVAKKYMGLEEFTGTYDGNSNVQNIQEGRIQVTDNTPRSPVTKTATYDLGLDWLGEEVKVLYKESKDGSTGLDVKDTVYGVYNTGETQVYYTTKGDLQDTDTADTIKFGDVKYDAKASINLYVNYDEQSATTYADFDKNGTYAVASNDAIKFTCDAAGDIETAYVTTSQFGKISSLTSDKIAIEGHGTEELKNCEVYADAKVGDLVKLTISYDLTPGAKTVYVIEKADATVTGTIQAYKADSNQVQIDGTWYKYGANKAVATDFTADKLAAENVDNEVELFVDGNYYFAYNKISGFGDYAIVTIGNQEFGNQRLKMLKADGTEVTTVKGDLNDGATLTGMEANDAATGKLFAYNLKSDNSEVDLSAKDYTSVSKTYSFNGDNDTLKIDATTYVVASDAVVFVYSTHADDLKWRAYNVSALGNFKNDTTATVQYIVKDSKIVAFAVQDDNFPTAGSDSTAYGYVTDRVDRTLVNGDKAVQLTVWDGENSVIVNVDGATTANKGDFIEFPVVDGNAMVGDSDVKVERFDSLTSEIVKIKTVESGRIIITSDYIGVDGQVVADGADKSLVINSDTKIIGINSEDAASSANNSLVPYNKAYKNDFKNAYVIYDATDNNKVKAIFIDEDNKLIPYTNGTAGAASGVAGAEVTVTDYTTPITSALGTMSGVTISAKSNKAKVVQGEIVTVTVTIGGSATKSTEVAITGVTPTGLTVSGSGLTKVDNKTFRVAKDATSGTVTFTYAMGASYTAPVFTGTAALAITAADSDAVDGTAAASATFSTTSAAEAFEGDKVSVTLTLSKALANDATIVAGTSNVTVPADTKIAAGTNSVTFEVTMGASAADLGGLTVTCNS